MKENHTMIDDKVERALLALEKIANSFDRIASHFKMEVPARGTTAEMDARPHDKKEETTPEVPQEETTPVTTLGFYEDLLAKEGLPFLKTMCADRNIEFLPAARSKSIIDLLNDYDARRDETGAPPTTEPENAPAPEAKEEDDPFSAPEAPAPKPATTPELTLESVKDTLRKVLTKAGSPTKVHEFLAEVGVKTYAEIKATDTKKLEDLWILSTSFLKEA